MSEKMLPIEGRFKEGLRNALLKRADILDADGKKEATLFDVVVLGIKTACVGAGPLLGASVGEIPGALDAFLATSVAAVVGGPSALIYISPEKLNAPLARDPQNPEQNLRISTDVAPGLAKIYRGMANVLK